MTNSKEDLFGPLNEAQRIAVAHVDGPLLILAGPGSGKTRVITHRIANMIASGIPSENIVALTFTNKAANEMRVRLGGLVERHKTWTGTFHKFCARLLRIHAPLVGLAENFTIYDSSDAKKVMKQAIENAEVDLRHYSADSLTHQVSSLKSSGVTADRFVGRPGYAIESIVERVYPEYQRLLQLANGVDFDDLLLYAVDLLRTSPELRAGLDRKFTHVMVDEYQDTNVAQYQLIRMLNHDWRNLAVTGDPDQSIYGWRGANVKNILNFEKDYPDVTVIRLEQNYRSTKAILSVADQLIENNEFRKPKKLITDNEQGDPVRLVAFASPQDEAIDIADTISLAIRKGEYSPNDFAIFYRTNWLSRSLEHALRGSGVPYQVVNGHEFYQRKEIKDLIGYLHLLNNPRDNVAFERVINTPARKLGKVTVGRLRRYSQANSISMMDAARGCDAIEDIKSGAAKKIKAFVELFDRIAEVGTESVNLLIQEVLHVTGYREWLTDDGSEEGFERAKNVDELVVATEEFDREHPEEGGLESYLEQTMLVNDVDGWDGDAEYVTLMTLHAAKGLEFPYVFMVGLEDGVLPHERSSNDDEEIEEERRLMFVGITRAEKKLQLSRCMTRFRRGSFWPQIASRFLMELPREEMAIFEPQPHELSDHFMQDADPWSDDALPSIDINADMIDVPTLDDDSPTLKLSREVNEDDGQVKESAGDREFPRLVTAAELLNRETVEVQTRLHPSTYKVGMEVEHADYGIGVIEILTGQGQKRTATVDFPKLGRKRFRVAFCNLRPVE